MFAGEAVADVMPEVLAFGVCGQEVAVQFWREVQIAVEFAAAEAQIKDVLGGKIRGGGEHAGVQELPMHDGIS